MKTLQAVIFDCDGVMFDSKGANLAYYNRILTEFGYEPVSMAEEERAHLCHTGSSADVIRALIAEDQFEQAMSFATSLHYEPFIPEMLPSEGLREVLERLHGNYPLAIATNRGRSIDLVLEHFGLSGYFDVVVSCQDVKRPKPAPDMLLLAVEKLQVDAGNCLFIGDSELDQQAAQGARVRFASYGGTVCGEEFSLRKLNCLFDFIA